MNFQALEIQLHGKAIGHLFRFAQGMAHETIRFVPHESYIENANRNTLSLLFNQSDNEETKRILRNIGGPEFNGTPEKNAGGFLLPAWFQNLLPEGAFRAHIAQLRNCAENDHFELLAACGKDLPGAVTATPASLSHAQIQRLVTQDQDALEPTVIDSPMLAGISLSGVQPKIGVNLIGGRYVARKKLNDATHVIAKLPTVGYPRMPELEHLSMEMARVAGVNACVTQLVPLALLDAEHGYDLGDSKAETQCFLAVPRYDRNGTQRIHTEDMAQVLSIMPREKYALYIEQRNHSGHLERTDVSYALLMELFLQVPSLGEQAVFELIRRLAVNELLGNPDCHLKNIGLYYPDGIHPELPPAYDIVALHVYNKVSGHALSLAPTPQNKQLKSRQAAKVSARVLPVFINPHTMRTLAEMTGIAQKRLSAEVSQVVRLAEALWPNLIEQSKVTSEQKAQMLTRLREHPVFHKAKR